MVWTPIRTTEASPIIKKKKILALSPPISFFEAFLSPSQIIPQKVHRINVAFLTSDGENDCVPVDSFPCRQFPMVQRSVCVGLR